MATKAVDKNLWENDPHLLPKTDSHMAAVQQSRFEFYRARGVQPGDSALAKATPDFRRSYAKWWSEQGAGDAGKA